VLALLVYQNPNLLLLDEPTNHLDLEMRHALSVALQDYQGAMLVVSHDRHLLRSVTDSFLLVANGQMQVFDGDLDDYRLWLSENKKNTDEEDEENNNSCLVSRKDQRKQDAERRQRLKPLLDAVKKATAAVDKYHQQQQQLEQQLAEPSIYSDTEKQRLKTVLEQKTQVDKALAQAESDWMEAELELESAE
jgi:ATP-binding cassette subfamily F protein 3